MSGENVSSGTPNVEVPKFDIAFQNGLLKLALNDDHFCAQMVKYFGSDGDSDFRKYQIFDSEYTQQIFNIMVDCFKEANTRPSVAVIRQYISEVEEDSQEGYFKALDDILRTDIHDEKNYRDRITGWSKHVKLIRGFNKVRDVWRRDPEKAHLELQQVVEAINRVEFDKEDIVKPGDVMDLIREAVNSQAKVVPTGIAELDEDLLGGLPRESLITVLGGTNTGKSLFCITLGCEAIRAKDEAGNSLGLKVLHINLEGMRNEAILRYMANLSDINYRTLVTDSLSESERETLRETIELAKDRLLIRNMLGFGATIEELAAYCREVYKDYKFDVLIVDYGQLLETKVPTEGYRFVQARVARGLDSLSKEFRCVVITPAQATRDAQRNQNEFRRGRGNDLPPVLRSSDISESFDIARVSGVILSLNRTDKEEKEGKLRVFLEKQRHGVKGKLYGLITKYSKAKLVTGETFDPYATIMELDGDDEGTMTPKNLTPVALTRQQISHQVKMDIDLSIDEYAAARARMGEIKDRFKRAMECTNEAEKAEILGGKTEEELGIAVDEVKQKLLRLRKDIVTELNKTLANLNQESYKLSRQSYLDSLKTSDLSPAEQERVKLALKRMDFFMQHRKALEENSDANVA